MANKHYNQIKYQVLAISVSCLLKDDQPVPAQQPGCGCRGGVRVCPVQGKCRAEGVIYRAIVTATTFKKRWGGHRTTMKYERYRHSTTLSNHIWKLKQDSKQYKMSWLLVDKGGDFNPVNKKCQICLKEKFYIMYDTGGSTLNKREEVYNTCRHKRTKLLSHFKS